MEKKKVIVIGGGIAGLQAAVTLSETGHEVLVIEKDAELGGKVKGWHKLFPTLTPAREPLDELLRRFEASGAQVRTSAEVVAVTDKSVKLLNGEKLEADAVVVCTGFDLFDATMKEEYGYGLYENVITSVDLEKKFNEARVTMASGEAPKRIALLHCVGSRDEKVCQRHCSRVCCITAVKQAIELKEMFPGADIYNFYMDIRMFGPGYEEMYRRAQEEFNIHFIRGRISEASETMDHRIQIKAEDTLIGRPLKMTVDMLVLVVGMVAAKTNSAFAQTEGIRLAESGFFAPRNMFLDNVQSDAPGIFFAGTATAPKNVGECIDEAVTAAYKVSQYLARV